MLHVTCTHPVRLVARPQRYAGTTVAASARDATQGFWCPRFGHGGSRQVATVATAKRALGKLSFASMASDLGGEPSRGGRGMSGPPELRSASLLDQLGCGHPSYPAAQFN